LRKRPVDRRGNLVRELRRSLGAEYNARRMSPPFTAGNARTRLNSPLIYAFFRVSIAIEL